MQQSRYKIKFINGDLEGRSFAVKDSGLVIGSSMNADIRSSEYGVAEEHITLLPQFDAGILLHNPGNGSEVNRCILEVYLLEGEDGSATASLYGTRQVVKVENLTAAFEDLNLITGQKYRLVLWADHVDDRLLDCFKDERIFPHFHLPIQSASNKVLERVRRKYTIEHIEYIIERMREYKDDPFIACDIIAGLPGEDDEAFQVTYDFLSRTGFAAMHVFPYSPREGTMLWNAKDRVEERVRDERAEKLRSLSAILSRRYVARQEGKTVEVIVEKEKGGRLYGTSGNYLKVEIDGASEAKEGDLLKARIVSLSPLRVLVI